MTRWYTPRGLIPHPPPVSSRRSNIWASDDGWMFTLWYQERCVAAGWRHTREEAEAELGKSG